MMTAADPRWNRTVSRILELAGSNHLSVEDQTHARAIYEVARQYGDLSDSQLREVNWLRARDAVAREFEADESAGSPPTNKRQVAAGGES